MTAETISAENVRQTKDDGRSRSMTVVQIRDLREQDFGYYEGKSFQARTEGTRKSGKDTHREQHKDDPGFQDVEGKDSMALRADRFLDNYLFPALDSEESRTIAVVSHGMLLSTLWRCILRRQSPNTVTLTNDFIGDSRPVTLEHLGGWSNTGFLELELASRLPLKVIGDDDQTTSISAVVAAEAVVGEAQNSSSSHSETLEVRKDDALIPNVAASNTPSKLRTAGHHTMTIKTINGKDHLKGLKRTGGGVGSSTYDQSQKTIGHFFKKQKR